MNTQNIFSDLFYKHVKREENLLSRKFSRRERCYKLLCCFLFVLKSRDVNYSHLEISIIKRFPGVEIVSPTHLNSKTKLCNLLIDENRLAPHVFFLFQFIV